MTSRLIVYVWLGVLNLSLVYSQGDNTSLQSMVEVIERQESIVEAFKYDMSVRPVEVVARNNRWVDSEVGAVSARSDGLGKGWSRLNVLFDTIRKRYRVHLDVNTVASDGNEAPIYSARHFEYSSNGELFMQLRSEFTTREPPDWNQPPKEWTGVRLSSPTGAIDSVENEAQYIQDGKSFMEFEAYHCGIGWPSPFISPYHEPPARLSEILKRRMQEGRKIAVRVVADGRWDIHFTMPYALRILYSPILGRVEQLQWGISADSTEELIVFDNLSVQRVAQYEYSSDVEKIPSRVLLVEGWFNDGEIEEGRKSEGLLWSFEDYAINPDVQDDEFELEFADGVEVTDHVNESIYVQGKTLVDDVAATREFLERNRLLEDVNQRQLPVRQKGFSRVVVVNLVLVVIVVIVIAWRKYSARHLVALISIGVLSQLFVSGAVADVTAHRERRCGQLVTIAALQLYGFECSPAVIGRELKLGKRGINLSRIRRILAGYGLQVHGRKSMTLASVEEFVGESRMVIFPIATRQTQSHYVLLMRRTLDGPILIIDPPRGVVPLTKDRRGSVEPVGGIALLIDRPQLTRLQQVEELEELVHFESDPVDLGDIILAPNSTGTSVEVTLRNSSSRPVVIDRITGSCGCIAPSIGGCVIDANSAVDIELVINHRGWGTGKKSKLVTAMFQGRRVAELELIGNGVAPSHRPELDLRPTTLRAKVGEHEWCSEVRREIECPIFTFSSAAADVSSFKIKPSVKWIQVVVADSDQGRRISVTPTVILDSELRRLLMNSAATIMESVEVVNRQTGDSFSVPLHISRSPLFSFDSPVTTVPANAPFATMRLSRIPAECTQTTTPDVTVSTPLERDLSVSSRVTVDDGKIVIEVDRPKLRKHSRCLLRVSVDLGDSEEVASTVLCFTQPESVKHVQ